MLLLIHRRVRRLWPVALLALLPELRAADDPVAVFAEVANGYARARLPDGSFRPETYAFAEGGCITRPVRDAAMEEMTFPRVARAIVAPLERLDFRQARTSAETDLIIMVFWGATEGSRGSPAADGSGRLSSALSAYSSAASTAAQVRESGSQSTSLPMEEQTHLVALGSSANAGVDAALWSIGLANDARDQLDNYNARILGYGEQLSRARFVRHMSFAQDIFSEIGENRYYAVLQAYDFKAARREKKLKPLWTVRLSMSEQGNGFGPALEHMLRHGAKYFGQETNGLKRDVTREGTVKLGPTEILGTVPEK